MPESLFSPNGKPLTPEELTEIAKIRRKDVNESIRISKGLKPYLLAKNQSSL